MIQTELIGDREVQAALDSISARSKDALRTGIGRLAVMLQRNVVKDKLQGQVLKVRTGLLQRSIAQMVEEDGDKVSGVVSSAVKYAAYHEFGFSGTEDVRAHLRRSREQFALRKTTKSGRESKASAKRWAGKGAISVGAHTRTIKYPAHSFLRTALAELDASGAIKNEIDKALRETIR